MDSPIEKFFFFALLATVSLAFLGLLSSFIIPLFWAITLAIIFEPLCDRIAAAFGNRGSWASIATITIIMLAVVLPLMFLAIIVTGEATALIAALEAGNLDIGAPIRWAKEQVPVVFEFAARFGMDPDGLRASLSNVALTSGQWIASHAVKIGQNTVTFLVMFMLMLYLLYFFLRDGHSIVDRLVQILPLGDVRERQLFARFSEVVRATVKGTFVIGAVQGTIGGTAFALLGLRGAVLWGVMMALLSLLPAVGAALVWIPAAIYLFTTGDYVSGIILIAVGVLVIGLADNLLRPVLVGRDTRMPDYLILLATLGGLALFGISGLVIGPLIAALFITLWEMFEQSYGDNEFLTSDPYGDETKDATPLADAIGQADAADEL